MARSTTINYYKFNPATKTKKLISSYRVTSSRKHGRPRNVGKTLKIRKLEVES